jgi:hypothetical protein
MNDTSPEPTSIYLQLRSRILSLQPAEVGLAPSTEAPHVWGVLMETGYKVGLATLVSLADGTTSLYYSTGGGMLGSGEYTPIAQASKALVAQAENHFQQLSPTEEFPLPEVGQVRFLVLTYAGAFTAEATEKKLAVGKHALSPLYTCAQEILTQLRLLVEKKRK